MFIFSKLTKAVFVCLFASFTFVSNLYAKEPISTPALRVVFDNQRLRFPVAPELVEGMPHLPLRFLSEKLGASVRWDTAQKKASVSKNGKTMTVSGVLRENRLMAPLSFFAEMFGVRVKYYEKGNLALVYTTGKLPTLSEAVQCLPAFNGYSEQDLYWLSRIVEAEANGESYASKLGVANVIINRKKSNLYPSTIKSVIFDQKHGVQFTPILNGAVYNTPSDTSRLAALEALEGRNNASDTLFFLNPSYATSKWVQTNRQYAFTIGGHNYYY
jgi:hypothetical protein